MSNANVIAFVSIKGGVGKTTMALETASALANTFDKKVLFHIYNANNAILDKLKKGITLTTNEQQDVKNLPASYLICYLNLFHEAIDKLNEAKPYLKAYSDEVFNLYKESLRILRKVKYS